MKRSLGMIVGIALGYIFYELMSPGKFDIDPYKLAFVAGFSVLFVKLLDAALGVFRRRFFKAGGEENTN